MILPSQKETVGKTESIRTIDEHTDDIFHIEFENYTPLLQMSMDKGINNMAKTKRMYRFVEGIDRPVQVPVYSSNAMRGTLRRLALKTIVDIGQKYDKSYKPSLSPSDLNFYASGADSTVASLKILTYEEIERLRELMPNISLFGAGLSLVEGKTAVSELFPKSECIYYKTEKDEIKLNQLISNISAIRFDETKRTSPLTPLLDEEAVKKWVDFLKKNMDAKKQKEELLDKINKKINDEYDKPKKEQDKNEIKALLKEKEKIEKSSKDEQTIMPHAKEYVVPHTKFEGAIWAKRGFELTEIEMGMLFKILAELSLQQLGSCKKDGFGIGKWVVTNSKYGSFENEINESYFFDKREVNYSKEVLELIAKFDDWVVANKVWEYLPLKELYKRVKESKGENLFK